MTRKIQGKLFGSFCLMILVIALPIFIKNEYYLHILIITFLNILIASSFRLIMTTGLVSFCHTAFMAIGGYTSALTVMRLGLSSWIGLLFGVIVTMVVSISIGWVVLRLKGTYFFLATFAFGEVVMLIFTRWTNPFGGPAGLVFIPPPSPIVLPGLFVITFGSKASFYYLALILMLFSLFIIYKLDKGRMGSIWTGIQQSEELAQSVGINTLLYKILAFTIGSSIASLAGSFQAHYFTNLHPGGFGFFLLINYLIFVIVGGVNKFIGPVIGATLFTFLGEWLTLYESLTLYQTIIYGLLLIFFIMFLPEGIVGLPDKISSWYRRINGPKVEGKNSVT
jgi:branched-chain amino acid transport system permease protein